MIFNRRTVAHALPTATLALAAVLQFGALSAEHAPGPVKIVLSLLAIGLVFATVFATLHHAEAIAHRIGEPYGTLVLTLAVTTIEVSVIVSMMLHGENNPTLARESVFSTVMIICGGVVGVCLTFGGLRHKHQELKRQGTNAYLAMLAALAVLTLVLPNYTLSAGHGNFSPAQLVFVSLLSVLLYASFAYAQMGVHREDFVEELIGPQRRLDLAVHGGISANVVFLFVGLAGIVLLAEDIAAGVEDALVALQVEQADAIVGAFIATLVLLPESLAAVRASLNNELQRSLNIALGSACATIGLTIPAVSAASLITGKQLTLGLGSGDTVLLLLGLGISVISFGTGRTTFLTGLVHLVIFSAYVFLIFFP
ncbi:ionic transporter [Mesorhizobium sp. KR9-304]|uniref:calcium:proton antiporter n=1 Tax=Mesorhizobium sp. KR9-304 TaxID=3156614 RepID=UPI0032B551AE